MPDAFTALYHRFAELMEAGQSDVDADPLAHVADAFMIGTRRPAAPLL